MAWYDVIFRGFYQGHGKKPRERVKDVPGRGFEDVQGFRSFGGILNDGFIDISFDSKEMYAAFLKMAKDNRWGCLCLPSPKGGHTYWKNSRIKKGGTDKKLACGLVADIKDKNTYIPLRVDGADRFPPDYDAGDYQEVPEELLPVHTNMNLWQMSPGEGRNSDLFGYILVLQGMGMGTETVRRIIRNINRFILREPLGDGELEVILRDEAFTHPVFFDNKGRFMVDAFSLWLLEEKHIVKLDKQLHIYKDGIYVNDRDLIEEAMISAVPGMRDNMRKETMKYLSLICPEGRSAPPEYVAFRNGIYDISAGELIPFSPGIVVTNMVPWDYDEDVFDYDMENMLSRVSCGDMEIRALLEECAGYCFYRSNAYKSAFMLTGAANNGKSTFLDALKSLLGMDNVSVLDLEQMDDRFSTVMMYNKLANIGDDISDEFMHGIGVSLFKKISAGNSIKAEQKGERAFSFTPYTTLVFSANEIPRIKDPTGAVMNRLIIIPFNAVFSKSDPDYDPEIGRKLRSSAAMSYLAKLGVRGLRRLLANKGFTRSDKVEAARAEQELINNPVKGFVAEVGEDYIYRESVKDIYRAYKMYCEDYGYMAESMKKFGNNLKNSFGIESYQKKINGKNIRLYRKIM